MSENQVLSNHQAYDIKNYLDLIDVQNREGSAEQIEQVQRTLTSIGVQVINAHVTHNQRDIVDSTSSALNVMKEILLNAVFDLRSTVLTEDVINKINETTARRLVETFDTSLRSDAERSLGRQEIPVPQYDTELFPGNAVEIPMDVIGHAGVIATLTPLNRPDSLDLLNGRERIPLIKETIYLISASHLVKQDFDHITEDHVRTSLQNALSNERLPQKDRDQLLSYVDSQGQVDREKIQPVVNRLRVAEKIITVSTDPVSPSEAFSAALATNQSAGEWSEDFTFLHIVRRPGEDGRLELVANQAPSIDGPQQEASVCIAKLSLGKNLVVSIPVKDEGDFLGKYQPNTYPRLVIGSHMKLAAPTDTVQPAQSPTRLYDQDEQKRVDTDAAQEEPQMAVADYSSTSADDANVRISRSLSRALQQF
jgi:hypothetical protein